MPKYRIYRNCNVSYYLLVSYESAARWEFVVEN